MYNNEQDDNKTQQHIPQPDPAISSGTGSYLEKDSDERTTGTEPKMDTQKSNASPDEAGKSSRENLKTEDLPKTDEKISGSNAEKDPDEWITGAEPMTGAQKSYLKTLSDEAGEPFDENLS